MAIEEQLEEWERRRKQGMRLLAAGVWAAEVARRVGVTRQSVMRWEKRHERGGMAGLERPKRFGRPPKLDDGQRAELIKALKVGAMAAGFATELWTLPRIATLIKERFGVQLSQPAVWRMLQQLGWSVQRPTGRARERDEAAITTWKKKRWPEIKQSRRGKAESSSSTSRVCPSDPAARVPGPPRGKHRFCSAASPGSSFRRLRGPISNTTRCPTTAPATWVIFGTAQADTCVRCSGVARW